MFCTKDVIFFKYYNLFLYIIIIKFKYIDKLLTKIISIYIIIKYLNVPNKQDYLKLMALDFKINKFFSIILLGKFVVLIHQVRL